MPPGRPAFSGLEAALDPLTIRQLSARGVAAGWSCLEIGTAALDRALARGTGRAGGPRVGADLSMSWANDDGMRNIAFRAHDIVRDPLEADAFDLIHAPGAVAPPQRDRVLRKLVLLRPGGWLVLEFTTVLPRFPSRRTRNGR